MTVDALAIVGPAEVRWNAVDGTLLGTATGPAFSLPVTIPDDPDGLYSVVVLERRTDGSVGSTGRAAFLILGSSLPSTATSSPPERLTPAREQPATESSGAASAVRAIFGGAVLLLAGGVGGALLSSRRRAVPE